MLHVGHNIAELMQLTETFMPLLDKHEPKKLNFIQENNATFTTKILKKTIVLH